MALATLHNSTLRCFLSHRLKTCALPFRFPISSFPIAHFPFPIPTFRVTRLKARVHIHQPRIGKSWAGAWKRGYAPTWFVEGYTGEWNMVCQITRTLLRRLEEVSQLLNEVGHLLCEAGQLSFISMIWSWSANSSANSCWSEGAAERLRHKSGPSVGKFNIILTTRFNRV